MKILAIRIENLASLEGTTEIDFTQEPLCSAGIFAITGPTGAGKSTILDALCLALYAKTPRYLQAKEMGVEIQDVEGSAINQSDARGILRDGTAEGFAEVDFVGVDGQHYRANWSVRRARNKIEGALQTYNITLKNIHTNSDIPGRKNELLTEIERLVGLNFEQFTRSILLAQGDFTAFLKAGKDEKSSLLEKLTGTHIYSEISKKVFEKHRDALQQLRDLNLKRDGVATLTTEELVDLEAKAAEYQLIIKAKEIELEAIGREVEWYRQLSQLQENFAASSQQHKEAYEAKEAAATRIQKLRQAEQVQPTRTWADALLTVQGQLDERKNNLAQINISLSIVQQQQEHQKDLLEEANAHLENQKNNRDQAQPILDEAKALDVQISERTTQVKAAEEDVRQVKEKQQEEAVALVKQQQEANKLKDSIGQLEQWKKQHSAKQAIADNHQLIVSKLADATQWLQAMQSASNQLSNFEQENQRAELEQAMLSKKQEEVGNHREQQQQVYQVLQSELAAISLSDLEQNKTVADRHTQTLLEAKAHWQLLIQVESDSKNIQLVLKQQETELEDKHTEFAATTKEVLSSKTQYETSLQMLNKARLAAAENVEALRGQLVMGESCPVCGSTDHPYAHQNPQLQYVLRELEEGHEQMAHSYEALRNKEARLTEAIDRLTVAVEAQRMAYKGKEEQLKTLRHTWQSFPVYEASRAIADEQKVDWLQDELIKHKEKQARLQEGIGNYNQQKAQLDQQKETIEQLEKDINLLTNQEKDVERKLQGLTERLDQQRNEAEKAKVRLEGVELGLTDYFQSEDWFANWQRNPEDFLQHINKFAAQWKTKTKELEESINAYRLLSATIKGKQQIVQRLIDELNNKSQLFQDQQGQLDQLSQQRKRLFEGEAISVVEIELKRAIDLARQQLDHHKAEAEKLQQEFTKLHTQQEQSLKDITGLEQQNNILSKQIEDWLADYNIRSNTNLSQQDLQDLLALGLDWLEAERKAIRQLDDAVTQMQSVLSERKIVLEKHQQQKLSDRDLETLTNLYTTIRDSLQETLQAKNEISFRLKQDEANKKQIGNLMQVIEKQAAVVGNWAKLNEIIGSADGKKFRQIAQEYTLDVLLSYANIHLEMLSKRYLLQRIPNTLGLQVLDQDMGDEVRTVYSLSGGESFLVSLALALGLASLSSSRMKVESLFIDEGFGSLDPNTLNIAMDALERLHNQGRKVGVISHVQEMTERIPVQIKVSKKSSGRSGVEVIE